MSFARNVLVQSSFTLGSRILGLGREMLFFAKLGAGPVNDAYLTALQFPNLFRRLLAEGAFSQAFVPIYSRTQAEEGDAEAARMATESLSMLFTATLVLCLAAQLAMPWIMMVLQAGYRDDEKIFKLSILLTQITMPYLTGMALSALFAGVLNAGGRFMLSAAAPTLLNICLITVALIYNDPTDVALAGSVAITVSGFLQAAALFWGVRRQGIDLHFRLPRMTPAVKRVVMVAVPGALAASATQINIIVSMSIASFEEGAKSWLASADRLYQLPLGIIGVAVGVAILPRLSRAMSAAGSPEETRKTIDEGIGLSMALTLPAAAALGAIPFFLIEALFRRGEYTVFDAQMSSLALMHYAWGVPAFVLVKVLSPAFFAREDTVTPMRYAVITVLFNTIVGAGAFFWLRAHDMAGFPGLAAATSLAAWLNVILLSITLWMRGHYRPTPLLVSRLVRVLISTAVLTAALVMAIHYRVEIEAILMGSKFLTLIAVVIGGGLIYAIAAFATGAIRMSEISRAVRR
ncbi:MAG: murein biosynthesis integral membrane protein MurJ [Hirschia sp.]|nr:murein biosynthesis integral membrane protein MurJ [Hirschia sp.]MBF18833.1 murein biosynthesis integral membrane protein MurJ [Hirschia sp.]